MKEALAQHPEVLTDRKLASAPREAWLKICGDQSYEDDELELLAIIVAAAEKLVYQWTPKPVQDEEEEERYGQAKGAWVTDRRPNGCYLRIKLETGKQQNVKEWLAGLGRHMTYLNGPCGNAEEACHQSDMEERIHHAIDLLSDARWDSDSCLTDVVEILASITA